MRGSTAERVADHVAALPERSFVAVRDVGGSRTAVESAFSRLAAGSEVAVLEVLRAGPAVVEAAWDELPEAIAGLDASGELRLAVLDEAAAEEPHRQARSRWAELRAHPDLALMR